MVRASAIIGYHRFAHPSPCAITEWTYWLISESQSARRAHLCNVYSSSEGPLHAVSVTKKPLLRSRAVSCQMAFIQAHEEGNSRAL